MGPDLGAAVWFQHLGDGTADLHLHAAPELRGRWVTGRLLRSIAHELRTLGYRRIEATPSCPDHRALLLRLGFEPTSTADLQLPLYDP